jgi:hypothetical protein
LGTGSLGRIEKKLDKLIADVRAGRREQTVLTMADDAEGDAEEQWKMSWNPRKEGPRTLTRSLRSNHYNSRNNKHLNPIFFRDRKTWKNELLDDRFTKVELEGHKHWIKARLQEPIESGGLQERPLAEENADSRSAKRTVLTGDRPGKLGVLPASVGSPKTPDHPYRKKRQPGFRLFGGLFFWW